ncbi:PLC-like phosphodiesterase [Calycina marina]|uniref:Phosphoinositide phospholipase C n=1 Tax=Calycina marina TaxID=1763456 RepID=A0A9P7Z6C6_9HELO|nr:PLC-like phosphodiesterase [Calycina marina]
MPLFSNSHSKQHHIRKLVNMSTIVSPPLHGAEILAEAGGGDATLQAQNKRLILSQGMEHYLKKVYDKLRGREQKLSSTNLAQWLAETQGQAIPELHKEGGYNFQEFLEVVYFHDGFEAMRKPEKKDLSRPISNYFISSSHNTYLDGNQLTSKSSTDAYKNVLLRGCRCIEIDVHNGEESNKVSDSTLSLPSSPKKEEHKRHMSSTTLSNLAAEALEKGESKYKEIKSKISGSGGDVAGLCIKDPKIDDSKLDTLSIAASTGRPASMRSMRNGEPLVLHGWTLTAPVPFRDVCKAVRESAFVHSQLPIIVSLEVHANLEQQEVMVNIMKEEWAGYLIDEAHEACNPDERLPRLDELERKILIKVKKASVKLDPTLTNESSTIEPEQPVVEAELSGSEDETAVKKKGSKICDNLSNLGIYTHSEHFDGFEADSAKRPSHIFSIGENKVVELHEKEQEQMFRHNRDFFMRAYPAGFRIDSSNLDASIYWRKGIQMVALNWQNIDEGMMLNEGMFAGEQGWVLKPEGFRSDTKEHIPYKTLQLRVTVYGGQHLPLPPDTKEKEFHPYVKCELHAEEPADRIPGAPVEGARKSKAGDWKHKTGSGKGISPDFGGSEGTVLDFPLLGGIVEELSFVRYVDSSHSIKLA